MEVDFGQEGYATHFDSFMRHYLTVKTGEIPNVREVYEAFKQHARSPEVAGAGVEALVADIRAFAGYFCAMALGSEPDADLKAAFHDLRELKVDVAFPFLLELYDDYAAQRAGQGRVAAARRAGRELRVPAGGVRHPYQLDEQDLRDLHAGAQEGPLPGEHRRRTSCCCRPIVASRPTRNSSASCRSRTSTTSAAAATGCAGWRTTAARSGAGGRVHHRAHPAAEREPLRAVEGRPRAGVGAHPEDLAAHARQSDADRLQPRTQRPALHREARHEGRLRREPAADEPGLGEAGPLDRGRDQGAGGHAGGTGGRRVGGSVAACGCARRLQAEGERATATPSKTIRTCRRARCARCSRRSASRSWPSTRA